ncbi:cytochrome P450 [Streptomyces purpureus]|uniref:cytochrome P450 n=1 Tax=Streptomyces purpureus TaxID=1951 RepID=UPI000D13BF73|nr:cytochrome P450 [Streptomyces purpureus]
MAFGAGPHPCLGQYLATPELAAAFDTLFTRFPTLRMHAPATGGDGRPLARAAGRRNH